MQEVATGLWHWQAPHPEWGESVWPQLVSSYAIDDGERLLLFDPIAPPAELMLVAEKRELVVVLTNPWHERDTRALVETHNPPVFVTQPEPGSPDVEWLLSGETGDPHLYSTDTGLPVGVDAAFPGREPMDVVLWVPNHRAVVAGDTLVDFGDGLIIHEPWLSTPREQVVGQLRPLWTCRWSTFSPRTAARTTVRRSCAPSLEPGPSSGRIRLPARVGLAI